MSNKEQLAENNERLLDIADKLLDIAKGGQLNVTCDIPMHMSINESGGLRITYDDGN